MRQQKWWLVGLSALMMVSCGSTQVSSGANTAQASTDAEVAAPQDGASLTAQAVSWPVLRVGSSGQSVTSLQHLLLAHGHSVGVDGQFGSQTEAAVRSFQQSRGLSADGIVGEQTWTALVITVREGSTGEAVKAVQKELGVTADGQFGPQTKSAVVSFQQSRGLTADGIVGPNTWRELVGSGTVTTSDRATLAQQILNNGRISLYTVQVSGVNDGADARSNIVDTAAGRPAKRSSYDNAPGGSVYLDTRMLRGMLSTAGVYSYRSTAIAGGSHSSNSRHYAGLAFDVDTINGVRVSSSNPYFRNFMQACRNAGADEVLGPGSAGHSTHVHCGWPR